VLVAAKSAVNAVSDKRNFQRILMPVLLPGLLTSGLLCLESLCEIISNSMFVNEYPTHNKRDEV
jgi:ABC-type spermidine/putrescine transport system permease subunit II